MTATAAPTFAPPGPGTWVLEASHFTRPATRFHAEIFGEQFVRGFSESLRRYGSLLDHLDWAFVNGFPYYRPCPVGAPPEAVGHPPKEVWDQLVGAHPDIRERLRTSASVFERRLWREDLERWDREVKPVAVREHRALLSVQPATLDTADLLAYLDGCRENQKRGAYLHHLFNVPALLPVGDLLVHCQEWTGRPAAEILGLLQGFMPNPLGADEELERLRLAIEGDGAARSLLDAAPEPAELLVSLRLLAGETGAAAAGYVDTVGWRPVNGEDVGEPSAIELPELIVGAIRAALERPRGTDQALSERRTIELRDDVPAAHRESFDELLGEARLVYRLRDERGTFADLWAIGIMRRAILAAGARLAASGRIADATHLVEADYAELRALVASAEGPTGEELGDRARYRQEARYTDAPPLLGGDQPGEPLPPQWLPPAAARLERALGAAFGAMFLAPEADTESRRVRGLGVSAGVYQGTARVVGGTHDFARIKHGDVLVTNSTTTAFNIVLPLLGAIVTDRGGLLSHAAIVSREYGIPAVVGTTDATAVVPDGALVRVDGALGEVVVLG
jgi:phosphohistidine swiveling domain-containing protein